MRFQREIKGFEARQRLEALVIPKRQALTQHQRLLAPSAEAAELHSFGFSKAALNAYLQVDWVYTRHP
jgi:hypothetical protein